jgi:phenylacetate-CoA ligase
MPDNVRAFWNPAAQTLPNDEINGRAGDGVQREFERVWDVPIPFHRHRLEAAGLSRDDRPALDEIPTYTKNDLRANEVEHPPWGTHRAIGMREAVRIGGSTGTTGTPVILMFGPNDLEPAIEHQCRVLWRYGVRPGDSFTHSWPQGFYMSSTTTALWFTRIPILEIPVGPPLTLEAAVDHIRLWERLRPDGFQMTSSQLLTYDEAAEHIGIDLPEIFAGKAIGLLDAVFQFEGPRGRIEAKYGFSMRNMGGIGEIPGFGVTDCHFHTGLHVPGDYVVPQVVDPKTGKSLPEGERGHLVLSAYGFDTHCLRYDVEDVCTMTTEPCPCGETGPRYTLLGRSLDAVEIDGRMILPIDVQLALEDHGAPELQFPPREKQDGTALHLRVEGEGQARDHEAVVSDALGVPVVVEEVPLRSLPRSAFKPRRSS